MLRVELDGTLTCPACRANYVDIEDKLWVDSPCPDPNCPSKGQVNYLFQGWRITYDSTRPVTGTWRAERFGVGMCNNSKRSIELMVRERVEEERKRKDASNST